MHSRINPYQSPESKLIDADERAPEEIARCREVRKVGRLVFYFTMFISCFLMEMFAIYKKGDNFLSDSFVPCLVIFIFYATLSLAGLYMGDRIGKVIFNLGWLGTLGCSVVGGIAWGGYSGFIAQILGSILSQLIVAIDAPLRSHQVILEHMCYSWTYVTFIPVPLSVAATVLLRLICKKKMVKQKPGL